MACYAPSGSPILEEAYELAPVGAVYVVGRGYREAALSEDGWKNCNLRTQFQRILKRAGVPSWLVPFQNLRASRATELARAFPLHVVTEWLGNTPQVALKHYLRVTDEDFRRAARPATPDSAKSSAHVAQNASQQAHAPSRKKRQKPPTGRGLCETVRRPTMGCQRPVWRGQDSSESRCPWETATLPPPALQKAVHSVQPIKS